MTNLKSSVQRGIKRSVADEFPTLEDIVDDILPKGDLKEAKGKGRINFVVVNKEPAFFRQRTGAMFPTLKMLHRCERPFGAAHPRAVAPPRGSLHTMRRALQAIRASPNAAFEHTWR